MCLNDYVNAPAYMKILGTYFESSLEACCQRYYSWAYQSCAGDAGEVISGYYPNWGNQLTKCLNTTESMPEYMQTDPEKWLYDDVQSCCENYYRTYTQCAVVFRKNTLLTSGYFSCTLDWALNECIDESGGSPLALTGTGKWYVNCSISFTD